MTTALRFALVSSLALVVGCGRSGEDPRPGPNDLPPIPDTPPAWAADAVWYEIDVDRFRDGDPERAPAVAAVARASGVPASALREAGWRPTPWTADPSTRADWERALGSADETVPLRRYGGDLQGVLAKLPYVDSLGVTALVVRVADPAAPWHVDPWLGPAPARDREMVTLEDPGDPATWGTSQADRQLLDLVEAAHDRGLRVVLDVGWPGSMGATSADADSAATNAFAVAVRWLDPDGDGDPSDGVDGFRLEADPSAASFHRGLRRVVKAIHPEAVLLGRVPADGVVPDLGAFDALDDPRAFRVLRQFLDPAGPQISAADVAAELADVYAATPPDHLPAYGSVAGGPEAPRLATALRNANVLDDAEATPRVRPGYDVSPPGPAVVRAVGLYRLLQATLPGAPHLLYGDEAGLAGARAPDNRRPMLWDDLDYAVVQTRGEARPVAPDAALRDLTARALRLRRDHADLFARGTLDWEATGDVLRFSRQTADAEAVVVVNLSDVPVRVEIEGALALAVGPEPAVTEGRATVAPRSGAVFLSPAVLP
ncbi:DUF3459 domain-containing protein [Rubrivirga marina]|uniref:Glycosyl hydrolase family 13 catalytic domain-containing protein n=1 Tax=Rubrivirga marina TaxID=1196024 RepID=A0A271IY07_9BACT|nr:DUF3459 domain-containing protein [Rubrivirga marina]PAP76082.1 hypothetical protein BSZ37_06300 [Rubrivirga marina]